MKNQLEAFPSDKKPTSEFMVAEGNALLLKLLTALPLDEKVARSIDKINEFGDRFGGAMYLSFSGGKDSTVVADLLRQSKYPDTPLVFFDTGMEYPGIRAFAKRRGAKLIKPTMTPREVLTKYGYPIISKEVSQRILDARSCPGGAQWRKVHGVFTYIRPDGVEVLSRYNVKKYLPLESLPIRISARCCDKFKKEPSHHYGKQNKVFPIVGTMTSESALRKMAWIRRGECNAFKRGREQSNPISVWTEQDILEYIKARNIEICELYGEIVDDGRGGLKCSGMDRTGCMYCPFGMHREKGETRLQKLRRLYPKMWDYVVGGGGWVEEDGKRWWMPSAKGLGFGRVFDMINEIYGADFYRYE